MNNSNELDQLYLRFPVLDKVVSHLDCSESDKHLLRDLFLTVYSTGVEDGKAELNHLLPVAPIRKPTA